MILIIFVKGFSSIFEVVGKAEHVQLVQGHQFIEQENVQRAPLERRKAFDRETPLVTCLPFRITDDLVIDVFLNERLDLEA